jgi:dTDP-4-amino-4,6-dideoxygalactose transaminase
LISLVNIAKQHERLRPEIEPLLGGILASGEFVLGRHVGDFEEAFAAYCGAGFAIGVNSGTSALHLALLVAGVGPGDEVITTAFSFTATAAAISYTGARPVLVDIEPDTFTIDPARIESAITPRTRAILPVHLYGHPAHMDPILDIARRRNLVVIEDAAQAHGALYKGRRVGSLGDAGCFSFYPSKNLGACGEAGIVVTNNPESARSVRSLRDWGEVGSLPASVPGFNYRMDAFQAAVLGVKLRYLDQWNATRQRIAGCYCSVAGEGGALRLPVTRAWAQHVFHIFAIRALHRDAVMAGFRARGIETRVHYPTPIHLMDRFRGLGYSAGDFPEAEKASREMISIPVHSELDTAEIATVADALRVMSFESQAKGLAAANR